MGRKRKKKKQSDGETIFGIVICIVGLFCFNQPGLAILVLIVASLILIAVKSNHQVNLKTYEPKPSVKSPKAENNVRVKVLPRITPAHPTQWSEGLIAKLEWRVFEKLCLNIWKVKGFSAQETGSGADGGVDFFLYAKTTKKKIGAVQCKSWGKRQIDVKVLRELQGVVASEQLKLGLLMYSGVLSKGAIEFMKKPAVNIKAQGPADILAELYKLPPAAQTRLLNEMTRGDYESPSCPNCDTKLLRRTAKKTGNQFWGCKSFPKCRYTMR